MKNKLIEKVGDVLSYQARRMAQKSILKSNADIEDVRRVAQSRDVDTSDKDYRDPLFRARANVARMKVDQQKRALKGN
jgi:hypothetical protein